MSKGRVFTSAREMREHHTPPLPLVSALAALNKAVADIALVVAHRGGVMLPHDDVMVIGLCDEFQIEFEASKGLRFFASRGGISLHDRLSAALDAAIADAAETEEFAAKWAAFSAPLDAANSLHELFPEVEDLSAGEIDGKVDAGIIAVGGDARNALAGNVNHLDGESRVDKLDDFQGVVSPKSAEPSA